MAEFFLDPLPLQSPDQSPDPPFFFTHP
jgi:hypothetical protein